MQKVRTLRVLSLYVLVATAGDVTDVMHLQSRAITALLNPKAVRDIGALGNAASCVNHPDIPSRLRSVVCVGITLPTNLMTRHLEP